ncbi:hypothetical protein J6Z19_06190 [bacterium]|nr:hypothetical protein [bacterium]
MRKFLAVCVISATFLFFGCGDSHKNKVDDDDYLADTEATDDSDSDSNSETYGGGDCNVRISYGSTSLIRDNGSVFDDCVRESIHGYCIFNATELLSKLQKTTIVFKKSGEHPDFIPNAINLSQLTGCNIYRSYDTPDDTSNCLVDCPQYYFSTDNEIFKFVEYQKYDHYASSNEAHFYSKNTEKNLYFYVDIYHKTASFKSPDSTTNLSVEILVDGIPE